MFLAACEQKALEAPVQRHIVEAVGAVVGATPEKHLEEEDDHFQDLVVPRKVFVAGRMVFTISRAP